MNRNYRKELPKLNKLPNKKINGIYIIPDKAYNGFWGKNGFKSFDFIFEAEKGEKLGWCHWEGDVIHLIGNMEYDLNIDCGIKDDYIRLFNTVGFNISDMMISDITIKSNWG